MFPPAPRASGSALLFAWIVLLVSGAALGQEAPPTAVTPIPVGINLRPITPYDRAWVFVDAMKMASEWVYEDARTLPRTSKVGKGGKHPPADDVVPLGPGGWPRPPAGRAVSCQFFVGMRGRFPTGDYVVTWKGRGTLEFRGATGIVSQQPNRLVVHVDSVTGGQPGIKLSDVDLTNPIRDIRVWLPGLEDSCHAFHPLFMDRLRPFSVLRFYPWMRVYTSSGRWQARTTMATPRQGNQEGVAIEFMVDLCNELAADPWFCIPHLADDQYVRNFATLVRDTLRLDAKIYLEFSNENWNTDFASGKWAREQGQLRGIPAMQVVAERSAQVFDIWHEVFGQKKNRIVRVAGVQLHNPGIANTLCRALDGKFDALAVGAYFSVRADRDAVDHDSDAAALMAAAMTNLQNAVLPRLTEHMNLATTFSNELQRPINLITYEGGQSIVARSPGGGLSYEATLQCQGMPEMFAAYRALLEGAQARGAGLFVAYDFAGPRNTADTFSILQDLQEPLESAVKYRALIQGWESRGQ